MQASISSFLAHQIVHIIFLCSNDKITPRYVVTQVNHVQVECRNKSFAHERFAYYLLDGNHTVAIRNCGLFYIYSLK